MYRSFLLFLSIFLFGSSALAKIQSDGCPVTVRSGMYNLERKQNFRNYLPPRVYFILSLDYFTLALIWIYVLYKGRRTVSRIHYLLLVLFILNAFNLDFRGRAGYKSHIKSARGWDVLFYIFDFLKGITLPMLLVLIRTRWSQLKPYLQGKANKILRIVITLQVAADVIHVATPSRFTRKMVFAVVDIVCYIPMLLPISESIENLRKAAQAGRNVVSLMKLTLLRLYYVVVIDFTYFIQVLVLPAVTIGSYENRHPWTNVLAEELATVALYAFTGYKFKPQVHSQYSEIDDEEKNVAAEQLKLEERDGQNEEILQKKMTNQTETHILKHNTPV